MKSLIYNSLLPLLICLGSCTSPQDATPASTGIDAAADSAVHAVHLGAINKIHRHDNIYFASQPDAADLAAAKAAGVTTVINLRVASEHPELDEAAIVEELGLTYVCLPVGSPDDLSDELFDRIRELLGSATAPVLFHCASCNRVGAAWLPWRVLDGGHSYEDALVEAKRMGLRSAALEERAQLYIQARQK